MPDPEAAMFPAAPTTPPPLALADAVTRFLEIENYATPGSAARDGGVCKRHLQAVWDAIAAVRATIEGVSHAPRAAKGGA